MGDKCIEIEDIDSRDLYGVRNVNISRIKEKFPLLKITVRGGKITLHGSDEQIARFEERLQELTKYYNRYGHISPEVIDQIYDAIPVSTLKRVKEGSNSDDALRGDSVADFDANDVIVFGTAGNVIRARTDGQRKMVPLYNTCHLIFAIGPAGSGKTYTAIALAVRALKNREVKKIILTRPAVEAGEKLGFLPGDMKEKLDPYLQPLYDALRDMIPQKRLSEYIEEGIVQIAPLAYMRGRTLDNAFVILDEAQNTTLTQMKMFLTRMGANAHFIVTGDASQVDLPRQSDSGLLRAVSMLEKIKGVGVVEMNANDIVRHALVKDIVAAFDKNEGISSDKAARTVRKSVK